MAELTFPTDPLGAVREWREAARIAEEARCTLKTQRAYDYLRPDTNEAGGAKWTDALRDAYADVQNDTRAKAAGSAAVEAKAAERWADFICEWTLRYESEWEGFDDRG